MDQITGIPRSNDDGALAWRFAHERLSQMLMEKVDSFYHLAPIMKLDGAIRMYQHCPSHRHIDESEEVEGVMIPLTSISPVLPSAPMQPLWPVRLSIPDLWASMEGFWWD